MIGEPFRSGIQEFTVAALAGEYESVLCIAMRPDGKMDMVCYVPNGFRQRELLYHALGMTEAMMARGYEAREDAAGVDV